MIVMIKWDLKNVFHVRYVINLLSDCELISIKEVKEFVVFKNVNCGTYVKGVSCCHLTLGQWYLTIFTNGKDIHSNHRVFKNYFGLSLYLIPMGIKIESQEKVEKKGKSFQDNTIWAPRIIQESSAAARFFRVKFALHSAGFC